MNKADIISKVHEVLGTTKAEAERAVDTVFDSIEKALKDGTQVSVAGFGICFIHIYSELIFTAINCVVSNDSSTVP